MVESKSWSGGFVDESGTHLFLVRARDAHGRDATEFCRERRQEMDEGAQVAWPQRYNKDELSGIHHAVNLKLRDEATFWAEYQNEPLADVEGEAEALDADAVASKVSGRGRGEVPVRCEHLTACVDVQQELLFWAVCAWEPDFTGYVVDYGTYPEQALSYFTTREVERARRRAHPGTGVEGAVYAGLQPAYFTYDLAGNRALMLDEWGSPPTRPMTLWDAPRAATTRVGPSSNAYGPAGERTKSNVLGPGREQGVPRVSRHAWPGEKKAPPSRPARPLQLGS